MISACYEFNNIELIGEAQSVSSLGRKLLVVRFGFVVRTRLSEGFSLILALHVLCSSPVEPLLIMCIPVAAHGLMVSWILVAFVFGFIGKLHKLLGESVQCEIRQMNIGDQECRLNPTFIHSISNSDSITNSILMESKANLNSK